MSHIITIMKDSKTIITMLTWVFWYKSRWIPQDSVVSEQLMVLKGSKHHKSIHNIHMKMVHWALSQIKVIMSTLKIDEQDPRLSRLLKTMEICFSFNRQIVWKTVLIWVRGKKSIPKWYLSATKVEVVILSAMVVLLLQQPTWTEMVTAMKTDQDILVLRTKSIIKYRTTLASAQTTTAI